MVLEKDEEDQLDRSCAKLSITNSEGDRNILRIIKRKNVNWICHIWCKKCHLKHVIEGKTEGRIEVTRRRGGRCKKLLG